MTQMVPQLFQPIHPPCFSRSSGASLFSVGSPRPTLGIVTIDAVVTNLAARRQLAEMFEVPDFINRQQAELVDL